MKESFLDSKGFKILFFLLIVVIVIIVVVNTIFMTKSNKSENVLVNGVAQENILTAEEIEENTNHKKKEIFLISFFLFKTKFILLAFFSHYSRLNDRALNLSLSGCFLLF